MDLESKVHTKYIHIKYFPLCTHDSLGSTNFSLIFFQLIYLFLLHCVFIAVCAGFLQLQLAGATLPCGVRASLVEEHCFQSMGSVVVAHGVSYSEACGIFLDQGSNLCPLHWQTDSYPLGHQGSPHLFKKFCFFGGVFRGFCKYHHAIHKRRQFYFFFSNLDPSLC